MYSRNASRALFTLILASLSAASLSAQGGGAGGGGAGGAAVPQGRGGAAGRGGGLGGGRGNAADFQSKRLPVEGGFRVYIVSNMPGMASVVDPKEMMAGTEPGAPAASGTTGFVDYEARSRTIMTEEANAVIRGARLGGANTFTVSDVHYGGAYGSIYPWTLDSGAVLVRGFPRPLFQVSGIDSTYATLMFDGAVASSGKQGVQNRTFGFSSLTVNGKALNEVGVGALIAGEMGVSVSLVTGDDALIEETKGILTSGFVPVITKLSIGKNAAITYSPAKVRQMVATAAAQAVRDEKAGKYAPFKLDRPYRVEFTLLSTFTDDAIAQVAAYPNVQLEKTGERSFRFTASDAKQLGYLIDYIQPGVIR